MSAREKEKDTKLLSSWKQRTTGGKGSKAHNYGKQPKDYSFMIVDEIKTSMDG